jgi:hypothetical protein
LAFKRPLAESHWALASIKARQMPKAAGTGKKSFNELFCLDKNFLKHCRGKKETE